MITRRALVGELAARKVADWAVLERVQQLATTSDAPRRLRTEDRTRWTVIVHHDVPHGRGSARLDLLASTGDARDVVEQAVSLASAAIGPTWQSPRAAAPAKVTLLDPVLAKLDLANAAASLLGNTRRPPGATVTASIELLRERVTVAAASGFHAAWQATQLRADSLVAFGGHSLEVQRVARRLADLELEAAWAQAASDLALRAEAGPPSPGRCAVILRADALLHGGGLGVWSVFADHASSELARSGLARYQLGAPIAPGADQLAEPLTITSDGSLDFAVASAPVGEEGEAVRRFPLVERGIATGLGLSIREAARRKVDPNGGVRNLVIARGTWTDALAPAPTRTIDVHRLSSLSIDPYTGDADLGIGLATEHGAERPFTGGTVRIDLIAALAHARRSSTAVRRGPYVGPSAVLIDDAELLG